MTITIGTAEKEGFISAYLLRFPNGLTFRTCGDAAWMTSKEIETQKQQFKEAVDMLEKAGITIQGLALKDL